MPLHDLSYQRHEGERTARLARSWALARSNIALLLRRRSFLLLLALAWVPAIVRAVQIYVAQQFPQTGELFAIDARLWQEFLRQQVRLLPVVLVSLYVGAGAIASDLSSGAFVVYVSKSISRWDYLLGKAIPVVAAIGFVTLVPGLLLLGLHLSLAGSFRLMEASPWLPLSIVGYSLWLTLYFGFSVLAVSSLSRSGRIAGAGFVALALGSEVLAHGALSRLRFGPEPSFLSMMGSATEAGHLFFTGAGSGDAPLLSALSMAAVITISLWVLGKQLSSAEAAS